MKRIIGMTTQDYLDIIKSYYKGLKTVVRTSKELVKVKSVDVTKVLRHKTRKRFKD